MKEAYPTQVVVLTGGNGVRMGELFRGQQKCLLPVSGRPVLGWVVQSLLDAFGSVDLTLAVGHRQEDVKEFIDKQFPLSHLSVSYVPHTPGVGTWGAYWSIRDHIRGPFVGVPGDVLAKPTTYQGSLDTYLKRVPVASLSFSRATDVVDSHGVARVENFRVAELLWPAPNDQLQSEHLRDMNIYTSDPILFSFMEEFPSSRGALTDTMIQVLNIGGHLAGFVSEDPWLHIGYPDDITKLWNLD